MAEELRARRLSDTLNVVAIEDPGENERSLLFVDINSNQTRVSVRDIWALMADIRPTTQVGYIANLIKSLNHDGPLKGKIHIPGTNASRGRAINIANIGKGIKDRNLLTPKTSADGCAWNVFDGDRNSDEYPSHPSKRVISSFNAYLSIVRESAIRDWHRQKDGFLLTNNGINVCLRVYAEMLRYLHDRRDRPTAAAIKKIMRNKLGDFIESKNHLKLRRSSSSEVGRGEIAKEICTYLGIRVTTSKPRAMAARV
jgi:hypothetical protein